MVLDAALAYLHFLSLISLFALLTAQAVLLRPALIGWSAQWLARVDRFYWAAVLATAASGLARAAWGAKGWAYYAHNPVFHAKLGLFALAALISLAPSRQFLRWARARRDDPGQAVAPAELASARRWVLIEVHLLTLLPLLGVMLARGMGF